MAKVKLKNQLRREKAKRRKIDPLPSKPTKQDPQTTDATQQVLEPSAKTSTPPASKSQTTDELDHTIDSHLYDEFKDIFTHFEQHTQTPQPLAVVEAPKQEAESEESEFEYEEVSESEDAENELKKTRIPMAHLKAVARHPQVVELSDIDAKDPYLLVSIKLDLNVVPVPLHWSNKRDYLAGKRGMERPPFQLPAYILETGIQDMRNNIDELTLRQQQRERIQPKMGKLDIDYQKLHDAFFKNQTRPKLFEFGDVYYEGRETTDENEDKVYDVKPGKLSTELLKAMGLPENGKTPPPWISTMREIGKPSAYSHLIIPGIDITYANVGYLLDEEEVYGQGSDEEGHWGDVNAVSESEEEEEDDDDDDDEEKELDDPTVPATYFEEENDEIEEEVVIRQAESNTDKSEKTLYTVLKDTEVKEDGVLTDKRYDLGGEVSSKEEPETTQVAEEEPQKFKF